MKKLDIAAEEIYEKVLTFHKIMAYISEANKPVEWEVTQKRYTELLKELRAGKTLTMPEKLYESFI